MLATDEIPKNLQLLNAGVARLLATSSRLNLKMADCRVTGTNRGLEPLLVTHRLRHHEMTSR